MSEYLRNFLARFKEQGVTKIDNIKCKSKINIEITKIGEDFAQLITNRFDVYDPPSKTYNERLATIEKAKLAQAKSQEYIKNL